MDILTERAKTWGDPADTHARIAALWTGILDTKVSPYEVALCMAGLKLVRASKNPNDPDSLIDAQGYIRIAQEVIERG